MASHKDNWVHRVHHELICYGSYGKLWIIWVIVALGSVVLPQMFKVGLTRSLGIEGRLEVGKEAKSPIFLPYLSNWSATNDSTHMKGGSFLFY